MLARAIQILLLLGVNAIPVGGVALRGWSASTALVLYWFENLLGSLLMIARIAAHRRLTRKRGHFHNQFGGTMNDKKLPTFLSEFTTISLIFTLAHGIFLGVVLAAVAKAAPDRAQVIQGGIGIAAFLIVGFLVDLGTLRSWPFSQLKQRAGSMMGRVVLVHLAILGGMFLSAVSNNPAQFFVVFGGLKTLSDIAALIPYSARKSETPPGWFARFARMTGNGKHWKTGQDVETWWRETTRSEVKGEAEDEEEVRG